MSLPHTHLVCVTTYRRKAFTGAMPTCCQNTMREVCTDLSAELVGFNGQADHVRLLVAYPPMVAISQLVRRLKGRPPTPRAAPREYTAAGVCAPTCADTSAVRPTLPFPAQALHRRSSSTTSTAKPDHAEATTGIRGERPRFWSALAI
ncbi:IS200/IS605 family transposase [Mycobacterium marinum]|uniref:IS200/IS605 family transposase n=1 Tax=Mycobacterium marinum TaxID=1781 RepID=UPI003B43CFED